MLDVTKMYSWKNARHKSQHLKDNVQRLETDLDDYYLTDRMESLLDGITMGQPFSLRYIS